MYLDFTRILSPDNHSQCCENLIKTVMNHKILISVLLNIDLNSQIQSLFYLFVLLMTILLKCETSESVTGQFFIDSRHNENLDIWYIVIHQSSIDNHCILPWIAIYDKLMPGIRSQQLKRKINNYGSILVPRLW